MTGMVLGLTGLARSGKDTVANIMVRDYGYTKLSFAAPLKDMLRRLDPIIGADSELTRLSDYAGWSDEQIKASLDGPEYRTLLQRLGTDCIRAIDDQFWIRAAEKQMTDPHGKYVFADVRFPNEAEFIYSFTNSELIEIKRPDLPQSGDLHITEMHAGQLGEGVGIINEGTLEQLEETVAIVVGYIEGHTSFSGDLPELPWGIDA